MRIDIKGNKIELTDEIKEYVQDKIGDLDKFVSEGTLVRGFVELKRTTFHHKQGNVYQAKADIEVPGKLLHAQSQDDHILKAVDKLKDELQQEIKKYKEQQETKMKKGGQEMKEIINNSSMEE